MVLPMGHSYVVTFDNGLRALQNHGFVYMKDERGKDHSALIFFTSLDIFPPCIDCI
jgi:hypothetical protein